MVDIGFKYNEFFMWFVIHVGGRDTGNVSTQKKECIVKPSILYTREFTQEKATMHFPATGASFAQNLCLLGRTYTNHKAQIPRKLFP